MTAKHATTGHTSPTRATKPAARTVSRLADLAGAVGHSVICTCQDCRDAALDAREAQAYDAWISHAVMVNSRLAVVLCGGCDRPMEALAETIDGMTTITTQHPCPCGWGKREG